MAERRTPLYDVHVRAGAQMVKGGGDYLFPLSYASPVEEHRNTRRNVGIQDLSSMGEVDVRGPGAERLLNLLCVNELRTMDPGRVRYTTMVDPEGRIVDDVTVYKFHDEHFMVVTSSAPRRRTHRWIADHAVGTAAYVTDISAAVAFIAVQGPRSRDLLSGLVADADVAGLRFFTFTEARIGDTELLVSRSGYTGELGFELLVPADEAVGVWERLLTEGKAFDLMPYGVAAMQSLRIEKALPLAGPDITEDVNPFEIGLDRWIRFDKREFIGREALLRIQEQGPERRWVGLVLEADALAGAGDRVHGVGDLDAVREEILAGPEAGDTEDWVHPGVPVGHVTSSARGHTVGAVLALAFVRTSHAWPGCRVVVDIGGRPVPAKVVPTPFFDPDGARMKG